MPALHGLREFEFWENCSRSVKTSEAHGWVFTSSAIASSGMLEAHATAIGVVVRRGVTVREVCQEGGRVRGVHIDKQTVASRWVIDASGRQQRSERWLGLKRLERSAPLMAFRGEAKGTLPDDNNAAHFERHESGWRWLAQVGPETLTWTILGPLGRGRRAAAR